MKTDMAHTVPAAGRLLEEGILSGLDIRFGLLMLRLSESDNMDLFLAAALASRSVSMGHVCLDLTGIGGRPLLQAHDGIPELTCPDASSWMKSLQESPVVGKGQAFTPLVLDSGGRLYLHRFWHYETTLADRIRKCARAPVLEISMPPLKSLLAKLFLPAERNVWDRQAAAAYIAATNRFCVISGGPGTGKTATAAKILALIAALSEPHKPRVFLGAPTGKAAARLKASIRLAKKNLPVDDAVKALIPEEAATLHRMLGSIRGKPGFMHNERNLLPADLVIVDEASMIDLPLMAKLFQALPDPAGIVLLGDSDQLASVESGYVLGDICRRTQPEGFVEEAARGMETALGLEVGVIPRRAGGEKGLSDCIITLDKNYRFSEENGIGRLSRAICRGDGDAVIDLLQSGLYEDLTWFPGNTGVGWNKILADAILEGYTPCLKARDPEEALRKMERFRILCAVNQGPYGVTALNRQAEKQFRSKGLIPTGTLRSGMEYRGRPIVVTRNQHEARLYNGDTGLVWSDPESRFFAIFPGFEGASRAVALSRLPEHETAYAMTVHKGQGSEFDTVFLVLPDQDLPILTRELLYTGTTRARRRVILIGSEGVIRSAVSRKIQRRSGLNDALWSAYAS